MAATATPDAGRRGRARPLDGILVVVIEQAVVPPPCGCRLADGGARVIKVEWHHPGLQWIVTPTASSAIDVPLPPGRSGLAARAVPELDRYGTRYAVNSPDPSFRYLCIAETQRLFEARKAAACGEIARENHGLWAT